MIDVYAFAKGGGEQRPPPQVRTPDQTSGIEDQVKARSPLAIAMELRRLQRQARKVLAPGERGSVWMSKVLVQVAHGTDLVTALGPLINIGSLDPRILESMIRDIIPADVPLNSNVLEEYGEILLAKFLNEE
jgi:hypothetical protein